MTLDEIEARADAATEGPWEATPNDRIVSSTKTWPEGDPYDVAGGFGNRGALVEALHTPDATFIAHAREDVPRLVAALRAVEAVMAGLDKARSIGTIVTYGHVQRSVRDAIREALGE